MSMIDRVARAMVAADSGPEGSALFDVHWREFGEGYMRTARAAIAAMREPSESYMTQHPPHWLKSGWYPPNGVRKEIWQQMIDEVLR